MRRLLTLDAAANELGVPKGSLRRVAEEHGFLVRMGRAVRIDPDTLGELVKRCRDKPRDHDSIGAATVAGSGSSATPGAGSVGRAQATAERLKRLSPGTSRNGTGQSAQVHPIR